jgi:antitoxin MazE
MLDSLSRRNKSEENYFENVCSQMGDGLAIRIPQPIIEKVGLHENSEVEILIQNGNVIISARKQRRYTLQSLLEGITNDNQHQEWDMGDDVGREL